MVWDRQTDSVPLCCSSASLERVPPSQTHATPRHQHTRRNKETLTPCLLDRHTRSFVLLDCCSTAGCSASLFLSTPAPPLAASFLVRLSHEFSLHACIGAAVCLCPHDSAAAAAAAHSASLCWLLAANSLLTRLVASLLSPPLARHAVDVVHQSHQVCCVRQRIHGRATELGHCQLEASRRQVSHRLDT